MAAIYFWSCRPEYYKTDSWRHVFSQWYKKTFIGKASVYDLSFVNKEDWVKYIEGVKFSTREKWMMVLKALLFARGEYRDSNIKLLETKFLPIDDPSKLRSLGRKIEGFDEGEWIKWREKIVVNGNYLQFSQDKSLKKILLDTKDAELVEASPSDSIWGIGFEEINAEKMRAKWGLNLLGKALMEVRLKIQKELN